MAYAGGRAAAVAALAAAASETIAALEVRKGEAEAAANALQDQYDVRIQAFMHTRAYTRARTHGSDAYSLAAALSPGAGGALFDGTG